VVYTPDGKAATFPCEEEDLIVAEIDPACVRAFREVFPAKKDRKKDLYGKLKVSS
jgi:predicted amidohydrolase